MLPEKTSLRDALVFFFYHAQAFWVYDMHPGPEAGAIEGDVCWIKTSRGKKAEGKHRDGDS